MIRFKTYVIRTLFLDLLLLKKPILLQGHTRPITQIKYNKEGDLMFSSGKDKAINAWFSINGERLGTYNGSNGAVWCIDVDWTTTNLVSGSADNTARIWDVRTGKIKNSYPCQNAVRSCGFSYSGNLAMYTTDTTFNASCFIFLRDMRMPESDPVRQIDVTAMKLPKITSSIWGSLEDTIITGHETGELNLWDLRKGTDHPLRNKAHQRQVMDLQRDKDATCFVSASKDNTAKLFDIETLRELKVYKTEKPVNSAAISPIKDHIVLGGGQEAVDAAVYSRSGKFEARFFHLIFEEEFGRVKDHFGPINSVAFHPDGKR